MKNMDLKQRSKETEKSDTDAPKVYGCVMPKTYEIKRNINYEDVIPKMYVDYIKQPKSNTFGLGYEGLDKSHMNLFKSTQLVVKDKDNKKLSISGQAFGVGAFENEDEDIYARDDMSQYDFELTSEKKLSVQEAKSNTIFDSFVLSKIPLLPTQTFTPPVIPHSFSGKHKIKKSRFEPIPEDKVERKDMTATIRAKYIGEAEMEEPQPGCSNNTAEIVSFSEGDIKIENQDITTSKPTYSSDLFLDKFVSASQTENLHNILEEVKKTESEHGTQEMRDAAKLKMYGPLTRIISDWQPCSLLCKRFNIREPLLDDRIKKTDKKKSHIIFEYQKNNEENILLQPGLRTTNQETSSIQHSDLIPATESSNQGTTAHVPDNSVHESEKAMDMEEVTSNNKTETVADNETKIEDKNTAPLDITEKIDVSKNIDLFKAVFLSSSESESEDEEKKEEEQKNRENLLKENILNDYLIPKIKNNKEGILSHIKFNPLFKNKVSETQDNELKDKEESEEGSISNNKVNEEIKVTRDPSIYGPVLPDKIPSLTTTFIPDAISDEEWVEKDEVVKKKSNKHKKKHKKEKHHKKEHKSKHKR
ncbi:hypothetical protein AMK59_1895 [Oryctes borbonicus]|uniref:Uncharacterized protein n=1 Tax=Oryctes borbonicus TaxID=1629725 RepID=A0A0T6BA13_9SCAR|nr:hypothetical protein AMK59_1895 [Oryctes borbonicus]